jgi:HSP20 family molecular chaperone IbpA
VSFDELPSMKFKEDDINIDVHNNRSLTLSGETKICEDYKEITLFER